MTQILATGFHMSTVIILMGWLFFCMLPPEMRAGIGFGSNVANWAHGVGADRWSRCRLRDLGYSPLVHQSSGGSIFYLAIYSMHHLSNLLDGE